jgi:hypothetical protein
MTRYWIAVASREHVLKGVAGGFCQACHGKRTPLALMMPGDWVVYYSSKETLAGSAFRESWVEIATLTKSAGPLLHVELVSLEARSIVSTCVTRFCSNADGSSFRQMR